MDKHKPTGKVITLAGGLLLFGVLLFAGCDGDDDQPAPPAPAITLLEAPTALAANEDSFYIYRARVDNVAADSVWVVIGGGPLGFALLDDGGMTPLWGPGFASPTSRDVAAGNGTFTRAIRGDSLVHGLAPGSYTFTFRVFDGGLPVAETSVQVLLAEVEDCIITQWPQSAVFEQCFAPFNEQVVVRASEADQVDSVWVELLSFDLPPDPGTVIGRKHLTPTAVDSIWQIRWEPTLFRCYAPMTEGGHGLRFTARTRFGRECTQTVTDIVYTNALPVLSEPAMPDTIYRPLEYGTFDTTRVTVRLSDCELAADTSFLGMRFDVSRDDTLNWVSRPSFFLRDNGRDRDQMAGDGIYSAGFITNRHDTLTNNVYYLRFYAVEGLVIGPEGQDWWCDTPFDTSAYLYDSVRVIQPPAGAPAVVAAPRGLGLDVVR